mmetsp:Transcript_23426/g.46079  ORF Transcript_23426/g.46079 Transcript_23426/m.46079 type:complete len:409 (+) Transcript_23426:263-1489(+)
MEGDQSEPPPPVPAGAPPPPEGSGPPTPLMPHPLSSPSRQSSGSQPGPGLLRSPTGSPTMGPPPPLQGMGNMGGPMHGPPQILQRPMQHGGMGGMGMQGGGPAFLAPFDQRPPPLPIGQGRFPLSMRMMGMNMPGPMGMNMPPPSGMKMPGPMRPGGMPGPPPAPMILGSIPPRGPPLPPPPPGGMGMGGPGAGGILPPSPYPSPSSSASPYASSSPRPSRGTNFRNRQPGSATRGPRSSKDARVYDSKFYTMEKSSSSSGKDGEFISLFAPEDEALRATTCHKGRVWKENRLRDDSSFRIKVHGYTDNGPLGDPWAHLEVLPPPPKPVAPPPADPKASEAASVEKKDADTGEGGGDPSASQSPAVGPAQRGVGLAITFVVDANGDVPMGDSGWRKSNNPDEIDMFDM